ncbi:cell wall metabolism sensor histidine kinase WalK [uncultured Cellulomonas sp.]|uniref:sensor histidine kinase n=1 Tax=uncultured Cellulomonas sp. TaxID=189682 RepID=UPI0026341FE5|nr:ATP-binding protein [uncultured Cellulomonas sp.]
MTQEPRPRAGWLGHLSRMWEDDGAILQRQVPFVLLFVLSVVGLLVFRIPASFTSLVWVAVAAVALMAVLAVALPWRRLPVGARLVLPALQLLAVGLMREGTGGPSSPFLALLFLPVVVASSERGRSGVVLSTLATAVIVEVPAVADGGPGSTVEGLRGLYAALVVLVVGLTVNAITERRRAEVQALDALRTTEVQLRERSEKAAEELVTRTQEVLRARDLFAGVIDAATEQAIIGTDPRGVIDLFNPGAERLLGWTPLDVVGRLRITDLHLPEQLAERRAELASAGGDAADVGVFGALVGQAYTGGSDVRDWSYVRADGSDVVVRVAVTRRLDPAGATVGYIFVATDMSEEREAARLKDEFVSLISHELRTPLSSILGYLELITEDGDLTAEQRQYLDVIERNASRLLRLVGDLLFTAQVEAGRFTLVRQPVDLAALVLAAVESARPGAATAGVVLGATGTEVPVMLQGDAVRLGQALDNLVSNAVKFTPRDGRVVVDLTVRHVEGPSARQGEGQGADDDGGTATVAVSDTGMGIPAAELDQLFSRFFRASTATRNAVPGAGLGLTVTQAIVTAHGGELAVRSTVGEGTTFAATLPLGASTAAATPGATPSTDGVSPGA